MDHNTSSKKTVQPCTLTSLTKKEDVRHGTLWVLINGNDTTGNGSRENPFGSIAYALGQANPGDTVIVGTGTYYEYEIGKFAGGEDNKGGTSDRLITLKSEVRHGAVIDGLGKGEVLRFAGSGHIVIDGFEVKNSGSNLIHADRKAHHLVFKNILAHHAGPGGDVMKFNQADNIIVDSCELSWPGGRTGSDLGAVYQELIDFLDVDYALVKNCFLHHAGNIALYSKGGSRYTVFENNIILGNNLMEETPDGLIGIGAWSDRGLFIDGAVYESYDMLVRNNIIVAPRKEAISIYDSIGARIYNNTIINPGSHSIHFRKGNAPKDESRDIEIYNNIFAHTEGKMAQPIAKQPGRAVSGIRHGSNLFWNNGLPVPILNSNNSNIIAADPLEGEESFIADPKFSGQESDMRKLFSIPPEEIARLFTPKYDSPANNRGRTSTYSAFDFFRRIRPEKPGIGALLP